MFLVSLSGIATVQHISKIKHSVLVFLVLLSHFNNFPKTHIICLVSLSVQHTPKTHHLSCVTFSSAHSKDPSPVLCHLQFSTLQRPIIRLVSLSVQHTPNQTSSFLWYFQFSQPQIFLVSLLAQHTPKTKHCLYPWHYAATRTETSHLLSQLT